MRQQIFNNIQLKRFSISIGLFSLAALVTSIQSYSLGRYNNYLIFKQSFWHLLNHKNLYTFYPEEYFDLYKYSPTFAFLFAPYAILPDVVGLTLWNLTNSLALLFGIQGLALSMRAKTIVYAIVFIELITSLQNAQSNALLAAGVIYCFNNLEKSKPIRASLGVVAGIFIKLFSGVGILLGLLYTFRLNLKFVLGLFSWGLLLSLLPLLFSSVDEYFLQLISWKNLLLVDESNSVGISLMALLNTWFSLALPNKIVQVVGIGVVGLLAFASKEINKHYTRLQILALVLISMVILNHKAESPTFIIAVSGAALWYVSTHVNTWLKNFALVLLVIFTVLSPTELFPSLLRQNYVVPYALKAFPCVLIALCILCDLGYRILNHYTALIFNTK